MTKVLSISVAMCTYNGEKYLPEQLASIAAQTRLPDEMVVCDDGSSDATPEIIEEFARTAQFPVRFIRNPQNLGSTKNFEKAIGLCTGDLIALSDQDDIWLPGKLARQAEMMERDPSLGGVFSDADLIDESSRPAGKQLWPLVSFTRRKQKMFRAGRAAELLLARNVVTGATLMIRADSRFLFESIPASWFHDGWIAFMLALSSRLDFIDEALILYRIHSSQHAGIENFSLAETPTLRQRLNRGKREEPAKQLKHMRDLQELEERLAQRGDYATSTILPSLRRKIHFFKERGSPYTNRVTRVGSILRNAANYHRYEDGWRCLVRDIVLVFV